MEFNSFEFLKVIGVWDPSLITPVVRLVVSLGLFPIKPFTQPENLSSTLLSAAAICGANALDNPAVASINSNSVVVSGRVT